MKLVIMAGGGGTRLWPLSRRHIPKQSQTIFGELTMAQLTFRRLRRAWPVRDIFVSTSDELYPYLQKQLSALPRTHFILEPAKRDTSAAIGLVAATLHHQRADEIMSTVNSDMFIRDEAKYVRLLRHAEQIVTRHPTRTLLIGTRPKFPDTSPGYFRVKSTFATWRGKKVYAVARFEEKPKLSVAEKFFHDPSYYVNTAWFVFRVDAMLEKFKQWLPSSYERLQKIEQSLGTTRAKRVLKHEFPLMEKISIDYGIMEKDRQMISLPTDVDWVDIGSWQAVHEMMADHPSHNVSRTEHINVDSRGNLLLSYSGKLIATAGLENMVVIETADAILVCPKNRSQDVKRVVAELEAKKLHRHL